MLLSKEVIISKIASLDAIPSMTGTASYHSFSLRRDSVSFIRENAVQAWAIDLNALYEDYLNLPVLKTTLMRSYVKNRAQSPACAILLAIGAYHENRKRKS